MFFFLCSVSEKQDAVPSQSMYPDAEDSSHVAVQEETQTPVGGTSYPLQCFLGLHFILIVHFRHSTNYK